MQSFTACWIINGITAYTTNPTPLHDNTAIIALLVLLWTLQAIFTVFVLLVLAPQFPSVDGIHCYCASLVGGLSIVLYGTFWQSFGNVAVWGLWVTAACVLSIGLEARFGAFRMVDCRLDMWLAGLEHR